MKSRNRRRFLIIGSCKSGFPEDCSICASRIGWRWDSTGQTATNAGKRNESSRSFRQSHRSCATSSQGISSPSINLAEVFVDKIFLLSLWRRTFLTRRAPLCSKNPFLSLSLACVAQVPLRWACWQKAGDLRWLLRGWKHRRGLDERRLHMSCLRTPIRRPDYIMHPDILSWDPHTSGDPT